MERWKSTPQRHPLLIDGARQVGKSFLIEDVFAPKHFANTLKLDFMENKSLHAIFEGDLSVDGILDRAQLATNTKFNRKTDLLYFEEVGLCREALESLKFFSQNAPDIFLVATGSNIGLFGRFPVGKTVRMTVHPFTFQEFLWANGNDLLAEYLNKEPNSIPQVAHDKFMQAFQDYLYVGGMPEAVKAWVNSELDIISKLDGVRRIQNTLIDDYIIDFGKFAKDDKVSPLIVERIFKNIPVQLAQTQNEKPMPRFQFKLASPNRNTSYNDVSSPISFLERLKLVRRVNQINSASVKYPLKSYVKEPLFKLSLNDIGLLNAILDIQYQQIKDKHFAFNGFLAEVFVLNEFLSSHIEPHSTSLYAYKQGDAEVEFVVRGNDGTPLPIEVKSGSNAKAKSLRALINKFNLPKGYKLTANLVDVNTERDVEQWPIYLAKYLYQSRSIGH
jgi:predicted AAA+ superfamily ATPase